MLTVQTCTSLIGQLLPEPHAGLLSGILFGTKMTLDPALKDALVTTGTLHIIALSGMNITILTTIVNVSLLWLFPRKIATSVTILVIILFIWFVGPSASIVRAAIMGTITCIGILYGKPVWALWTWGIAVVTMLVIRPMWITDLSFQLSVLASLGMILFGGHNVEDIRPLSSTVHHLHTIISADLRTTLAAQTLTLPLLFFTFGRISLISPITNMLIVWTLPTITVLGFLVVIAGLLFVPIGQILAWVAWVFLEYVIQVILWTSRIPFASVKW